MKNIHKIIFGGILLLFLWAGMLTQTFAQPFDLMAISSNPGPDLKIVLVWPAQNGVVGYNLYRKNAALAAYPNSPINKTPIRLVEKCVRIKTILGVNSFEWNAIANALADTTTLFDPCEIGGLAIGSQKHQLLMLMAKGNEKIARVAGLGYHDPNVVNGNTYFYQIIGVDANGNELNPLAKDVSVTAGVAPPMPAPTGVVAEAGDSEVLVRWEDVPNAAGYEIFRGLNPGGPFIQVNSGGFSMKMTNHLNGDTLIPATNGFMDFRRYTPSGDPTFHTVKGSNVYGPFNAVTHFYRIRSVDFLGRSGPMSVPSVSATPEDSTAPATPGNVTVFADEPASAFIIKWKRVVHDINAHLESPAINRYKLYRYESSQDPNVGGVLVNGNIPPPANPNVMTVEYTDATPGLRSDFGDKSWWFRIVSVDGNGNESSFSIAAEGVLADTTRPRLVEFVMSEGFEEYIALTWQQNLEPDLQGYAIYRSLCHFNEWIPCPPKRQTFNPDQPTHSSSHDSKPEDPCSGPFVFLGEIDKDSAMRARSKGNYIFEDRTVPEGSPLCYAYWIKAVDKSGNRSGGWPLPWNPTEIQQIVCDRLRDKTPPEPALISALFARDASIVIGWMGPPTQDTRAYHVYRAAGINPDNEPELAAFKWVGGMTVEPPPGAPVALTEPYKASQPANCGVIPVLASEYMSEGFFVDKTVNPKETYWYRVVGIDYDGNEGELDKALSVSTFTFTTDIATAPQISAIGIQAEPCALAITWNPSFEVADHMGFALFKSRQKFIGYTQVPNLIQDNSYVDVQVAKEVNYWYRIALVDKEGNISQLSAPQSGKVE